VTSVESTAASAAAGAARETMPVARLVGATVVLDDRAVLRQADLDIVPGVTVLRGPNGAGKTTALRTLAGLVPIARGSREVPSDVLYLGHRPQLLHGLTARENLRFFSEFRGPTSRAWAFSRDGSRPDDGPVGSALERWGLAADADRPVERLSAGQRRRAALARVDMEACELTLLDEPFAELDAEAAALLWRSLDRLVSSGIAVLIASHGHPEIDDVAVRVYGMRDGRIALARSDRPEILSAGPAGGIRG
jgi:ABC-type multidrug transport system ATPase subunit